MESVSFLTSTGHKAKLVQSDQWALYYIVVETPEQSEPVRHGSVSVRHGNVWVLDSRILWQGVLIGSLFDGYWFGRSKEDQVQLAVLIQKLAESAGITLFPEPAPLTEMDKRLDFFRDRVFTKEESSIVYTARREEIEKRQEAARRFAELVKEAS